MVIADADWSGGRRVKQITVSEAFGAMRLTLGNGIENPASCSNAELVDVPLDYISEPAKRQGKLMTDAVLAAFVADLDIEVLVDRNSCSSSGRILARGIRIRSEDE